MTKDSDGRVRRMLLGKQSLPSFPIAAAEAYLGHRIEIPEGRTAWIDYAGPSRTVKAISLVDVERGTFDPAAVRGKAW